MKDRNANPETLRCYRCGISLATLSLPLSRRDLCPGCSVELHVCRMCRHYAPAKPDACVEEDAPEVRNKTSANFCDWFAPDPAAFDGRARDETAEARARLEALFGQENAADTEAAPGESESAATERALTEAEKLFRK